MFPVSERVARDAKQGTTPLKPAAHSKVNCKLRVGATVLDIVSVEMSMGTLIKKVVVVEMMLMMVMEMAMIEIMMTTTTTMVIDMIGMMMTWH